MSKYQISTDDRAYAQEFRDNLIGGNAFHSPGLQRVLNVMRTGTKAGKYVLVVLEPFKRYALGRLPEHRGEPVEVLDDHVFDCPIDAEWAVFRLRWHALTGSALDFLPPCLPDGQDEMCR